MLLPILLATSLTLLLALILATTARLNAILPTNRPPPRRRRGLSVSHPANGTTRSRRLDRATRDGHRENPYKHIMVILGSGGHTAEMLLMLRRVRLERWERRSWVVSSGDSFSAGLAGEFERSLAAEGDKQEKWDIVELPRARRVHQSLLTAPWTSLLCLWAAIKMLRRSPPDIILTNGPGTGVIAILASFILRFFAISETRCVYVESLARCRTLSLSGRLVKPFVERFLVQWRELEGGRAEFRGGFALDTAVEVGLEGMGGEGEVDKAGWLTYEL